MHLSNNRTGIRHLVAVAGVVVLGVLNATPSAAQIQITNPPNGVRLAAGPDYATDVLGDAWDMSNPEDVAPDPGEIVGWSSFAVSGGLAGGTIPSGVNDTVVSFLFRGFYGIINPGKNGRNFPVDTSKYRKLAFRMSSGAAGQTPQVYWFHNPWLDPSGSTGMGNTALSSTVNGPQTWVTDLAQASCTLPCVPWTSGVVRGFRLDPNNNGTGSNYQVFFDWIRLTVADGAPGAAMQAIQWTGGGNGTIDILDSAGSTVILNVAAGVPSPYNWNYGVLPPGSYRLQVTVGGSQATQSFSINNPPMIQVTTPSKTSGEDYATNVLGNAWDMNEPTDIQLTGSDNFTGLSFSGGQLHATNTSNDPRVTVLYNTNNSTPIDTSKYRYLTYRLQVDGPFDLANGSVARVFWSSGQFMDATATTTKDIIVWAGMNSYTVDLASLSAAADGGLESSGAAEIWMAANKRHLRLDPHEFAAARTFHIDDIKLTAKPVSTGSYTIGFTRSDADGDPTTVTLYYDTDLNPTNGKTLITSGALGSGQFVWNTASVSPGEYYIYAEINDGVQTTGNYSNAPVQVNNGAPTSDPLMSLDTPGNGVTITQPFPLAGWAIDRGASSGTGVDTIHVYAVPNGGSPIFVGVANYSSQRSDVGSAFGAQFTNSGYNITVTGLPPGTYTLVAYAHSTVTGTFNQSRTAVVTIPPSSPVMAVDVPGPGASVGPSFAVAGWAIDRASGTGTGTDAIHIYAYPGSGGPAIFLGVAAYGAARGDVGSIYGARFTNSGYNLAVSNLSPGSYLLVVYAHSTVTGTFNNWQTVNISVTAPVSAPLMTIDTPQSGSHPGSSFMIAGWAIDRGAVSGTGVDAIHVWVYPAGGSPFFAGQGTYGGVRGDVGSAFGARFTNSGYGLAVSGLAPGTYDFVVYAHSTLTGTFNQSRVVRVIVP